MTIMRQTSSERWSIIKGEGRFALGQFKLLLESLNLFPVLEDFFFFLGEVGPFRHYKSNMSYISRDKGETYQWRT
jgi:hypothetical protein